MYPCCYHVPSHPVSRICNDEYSVSFRISAAWMVGIVTVSSRAKAFRNCSVVSAHHLVLSHSWRCSLASEPQGTARGPRAPLLQMAGHGVSVGQTRNWLECTAHHESAHRNVHVEPKKWRDTTKNVSGASRRWHCALPLSNSFQRHWHCLWTKDVLN